MIIDSHAHVMQPLAKELAWMDEAGMDKTVLFTTTIHPETATNLDELSGEIEKLYAMLDGTRNPVEERIKSIEKLTKIVKDHPDRFVGFGSIPQGLSYEENGKWLDNYIIKNGLRGVGELTPGSGEVGKLESLFQAAEDAGRLPLWVHAFLPLTWRDIKELLELARHYASVPLILGHLGGLHWLETLKAVRDLPSVYLDLSAVYTTMAPSFAVKEYPERTLFASDAPFTSPLAARNLLESCIEDAYMREGVLGGNIAKLLNL
ncbi:MAG: amidohydrolase family protein [Veillonellales bacterium]